MSQSADGESNKIVSDKKKTVTAWMFDTYRVRNHLVPNRVNSKLIRLKVISKNRKHKKVEHRKSRTNEKILIVCGALLRTSSWMQDLS